MAGNDHDLDIDGTVIDRERTDNRPHQRAQFIEKTSRQGLGRFASELSCAQTVDILRCMIAENS